MTVSLNLPSDLETELSAEASNLKLPLAEYILRILSLRPFLPDPPTTGVVNSSLTLADCHVTISYSLHHIGDLRKIVYS